MQYKVTNNARVEINGVIRNLGDVLEESDFQEGEAESLLGTGHVKEVLPEDVKNEVVTEQVRIEEA